MTDPDQSSGKNDRPSISGNAQPGIVRRLFNGLKTVFGVADTESSLRESLEEVIEEHDLDAAGLGREEQSMLFNVLDYGAMRADDIMVPRADIVAVDTTLDSENLLKAFARAAHSRLPVYRENLDDIIGMIHLKDVVIALDRQRTADDAAEGSSQDGFDTSEIIREVLFVAPSMRLIDLLAKMRAKRTHMAIVIDEYGGADGLVTIEDLVEQIVGDIEDEHDEPERLVLKPVRAGVFDCDARLSVEELEKVLDCDLLPENLDDGIDTVGGLVVSLEGRVPAIGESITHNQGYAFEVLDADPRRIKKLRIYTPDSATT